MRWLGLMITEIPLNFMAKITIGHPFMLLFCPLNIILDPALPASFLYCEILEIWKYFVLFLVPPKPTLEHTQAFNKFLLIGL